MRRAPVIVIGLMSGTSADAIDTAVVALTRAGDALALGLLGFTEQPYPPELRERLLGLLPPAVGSTKEICELGVLVGEAFAAAALAGAAAAGVPIAAVDLIASHGQTVYHQVAPGRTRSTLQLGAPAVIAERTGRTVVADFRPRDIAAGGQGAPLIALLDALLCAHPTRSRALQNIGGIANVTWLAPVDQRLTSTDHGSTTADQRSKPADQPQAGGPQPWLAEAEPWSAGLGRSSVLAFDTGPGNCLIDELAHALSGGAMRYDAGGAWAARGTPDERLLAAWLDDPFFALPPPKSTGREYFSRAYAAALLGACRARRLGEADALATVTALTARSIAAAYRRWLPALPDELLLSGGGAHNRTLVALLAAALPECALRSIDALGLPGDAKEALGFALLGYYTLHGWPANLPGSTGAAHPVVLGGITPGDNYRDLLAGALAGPPGPPARGELYPPSL